MCSTCRFFENFDDVGDMDLFLQIYGPRNDQTVQEHKKRPMSTQSTTAWPKWVQQLDPVLRLGRFWVACGKQVDIHLHRKLHLSNCFRGSIHCNIFLEDPTKFYWFLRWESQNTQQVNFRPLVQTQYWWWVLSTLNAIHEYAANIGTAQSQRQQVPTILNDLNKVLCSKMYKLHRTAWVKTPSGDLIHKLFFSRRDL